MGCGIARAVTSVVMCVGEPADGPLRIFRTSVPSIPHTGLFKTWAWIAFTKHFRESSSYADECT